MSGDGNSVPKVTLMLDVHALEKLFPEGSEARIELRRVAITEMSKRLMGNATNLPQQVQTEITKAIEERKKVIQAAIDKCVKDYEARVQTEGMIGHIRPSQWKGEVPTFELSEETKKAMAVEIKRQFATSIQETIGAMLPTMFQNYLDQDKIGDFVDAHIQQQLKTAAGQKVKALFGETA